MKLFKTVGGFIIKHERILLTFVTITAEAVAIYEGLKQGPIFDEVLEKVKKEEMTKAEAAKTLAVPAVKVGVPFALSATAAILNHKKASDTIQSVSSMLMLTKEAKDAYREQVEKYCDPETAEKIEHGVNKDRYGRDVSSGMAISRVYETGHGTVKFYDEYSGRYFWSDANFIEKTINMLNARLNEGYEHRECILLNELYSELGLPTIDIGENSMWNSDTGLISYRIEWDCDDSNQPCGTLKFISKPTTVLW